VDIRHHRVERIASFILDMVESVDMSSKNIEICVCGEARHNVNTRAPLVYGSVELLIK
jgi:hypothetical protein